MKATELLDSTAAISRISFLGKQSRRCMPRSIAPGLHHRNNSTHELCPSGAVLRRRIQAEDHPVPTPSILSARPGSPAFSFDRAAAAAALRRAFRAQAALAEAAAGRLAARPVAVRHGESGTAGRASVAARNRRHRDLDAAERDSRHNLAGAMSPPRRPPASSAHPARRYPQKQASQVQRECATCQLPLACLKPQPTPNDRDHSAAPGTGARN